MKEVEIKIQVDNLEEIAQLLAKKGCVFTQAFTQDDIVYIPNNEPTVPVPAGVNVLRIRREAEKTKFTLKRSDVDNHLSKLECELEISDPEQMEKIIGLLDYKEIAHTTKTRRICKINDFEICLDHVNELGDYLEIEKITDENPLAVQKEMLDYLSALGVDVSKRVGVGYDVLYVRKLNSK